MCGGLTEAIEGLSIGAGGDELIAVLALRDRLDAKLAAAATAFDDGALWDADGSTSLIAWLRHQGGLSSRDSAQLSTRVRMLRQLPVTAEAWQTGTLSGGHVDAIVAHVDAATVELFAEHEAGLVPKLAGLTPVQTVQAMRHWRSRADAIIDRKLPAEPERELHVSETMSGRRIVKGTFDSEGGAIIEAAIREATSSDDPAVDPIRTAGRRRGDALVDVCRSFLAARLPVSGRRNRPHVNIIIDGDQLHTGGAHTTEGSPLDLVATSTLLCDCVLHRAVMVGKSTMLDYGTATRTIPVGLWNALVVRDEHCRFPGCDRPAQWCEGHHVVPVEARGPTSIGNLVLLCSRHHHRLHQPGWRAKLVANGSLEITQPDGRCHVSRPPRALVPAFAFP